MIQKPKRRIIEVLIRFYMACLANRGGKNTCIFLEKLACFWLKMGWFLALKQGCFAGVKQGMSKGGCGDYNGGGFVNRHGLFGEVDDEARFFCLAKCLHISRAFSRDSDNSASDGDSFARAEQGETASASDGVQEQSSPDRTCDEFLCRSMELFSSAWNQWVE